MRRNMYSYLREQNGQFEFVISAAQMEASADKTKILSLKVV